MKLVMLMDRSRGWVDQVTPEKFSVLVMSRATACHVQSMTPSHLRHLFLLSLWIKHWTQGGGGRTEAHDMCINLPMLLISEKW